MNKIINHYAPAIFCSWLFLIITFPLAAQPGLNKYGLAVITKTKEYRKTLVDNGGKEMLDVTLIPDVETSLVYATTGNFMKKPLYPFTKTTYLRKTVLLSLLKVQQILKEKGLGIKIWDAYRPYSVTEKMWEAIKDERYVASPASGSGHNRGIAVDLTLIRLDTKQELDMGTGFDHFSDTAHLDFKGLSPQVLANRQLLRSLMESHGFTPLKTEWWHYYLPDAKSFEILDLSFKALKKLNRKHNRNP